MKKKKVDNAVLEFANFMGCHSGILEVKGKQYHYKNPDELYTLYKKHIKNKTQ